MKNPLDHLDEVVQALVAALKPQRVLLFGSAARAGATEINDLDLLVISDLDLPPMERLFKAQMAVSMMGVPVDVLVLKPAEFEARKTWAGTVIYDAARDGRIVYEAA